MSGLCRSVRSAEAVATGSAEFVEGIKAKLGVKAKYRRIHNKTAGVAYALKEAIAPYNAHFDGKKFTP